MENQEDLVMTGKEIAKKTAAAVAQAPKKEITAKAEAVKTEPVKTEAPKAEPVKEAAPKKAPAKKVVAKKETASKKEAAPKKAPAKKAEKETEAAVVIQYAGKEIAAKEILERAKLAFTDANPGAKIDNIVLYVKPEEDVAYYVVNGIGNDDYKIEL